MRKKEIINGISYDAPEYEVYDTILDVISAIVVIGLIALII